MAKARQANRRANPATGPAKDPAAAYAQGGHARPELISGHVALDLVNTVSWRLDPARTLDRLSDTDALVGWVLAAGVLPDEQAQRLSPAQDVPAASGPALERVRRLRESAYRLLRPIALGSPVEKADVERVQRAVTRALAHARVGDVVPWRWEVDVRGPDDLPTALTLEVWRLLQFEDLTRLRECRDRDCGWLFLDRSKNASRTWCSSADCGNRKRARRHYERVRESTTSGDTDASGDVRAER
ncbi:MAG: CGNR zinc finger domain-containing protein [Nocardioidaceae bacterium]